MRLLSIVDAIGEKLGVEQIACKSDLGDLKQDVNPAELIEELNRQERKAQQAIIKLNR